MASLPRLRRWFSSSADGPSVARGRNTGLAVAGIFLRKLALHAFVEPRYAHDDAPMGAAADRLELVARRHLESDGAAFDPRHLRGCGDSQPDRRGCSMTDIEVNTQALVARWKQVFDRRQGGRFDQIDHHWSCQHRDPTRSDKGRGMLRPNHDFSRANKARNNPVEQRAAAWE